MTKKTFDILIVGCGNIGALYDFDSHDVLTHAKAFFNRGDYRLLFYDIDPNTLIKVCERYQGIRIENISDELLGQIDCMSICTPTETHYELLCRGLKANISLIICEKPISLNKSHLTDLKNKYQASSSKILVNYIRRFQPTYHKLKSQLSQILGTKKIQNISIRYHKGFMNNCSHAFDLIEFLTNSNFRLKDAKTSNIVFDFFKDDPTISLVANWNEVAIDILGLVDLKISLFEIDILFDSFTIKIFNRGNDILTSSLSNNSKLLNSSNTFIENSDTNCLRNYMNPITDFATDILKGKQKEDNFLQALELNLSMIEYLKLLNN